MQVLIDFFSTFQSKDWTTFIIGSLAFAMSLLSYFQRKAEAEIALRKQLTDLLEKLSDLNTEVQKSRVKPGDYPTNYSGLLNDKRRFLVRQARFIINIIESMVSPFEFLLLAGGFADANDYCEAEKYFELAISTSKNPVDKGIAMRGYGRYLFNFSEGRQDEARKLFENAINIVAQHSDYHREFRANTYERLADLEYEWGYDQKSLESLGAALNEYGNISNPNFKEKMITKARNNLTNRTAEINKKVNNVENNAGNNKENNIKDNKE